MSRFNNPKALAALGPKPSASPVGTGISQVGIFANASALPKVQDARSPWDIRPNAMQAFCFFILCAYLLSGYANDFALHLLHGKAYISTVTVILLPLAFLASGTALRAFQSPSTRWWFAFAIWLAICFPFSFWKSDTLHLLTNYYLRFYLVYFVICACCVALYQLRNLMRSLCFGAFLVVLACFAFGAPFEGRFSIIDSPFFANANELALQLLLGIIVLLFPFFGSSKLAKAASVVGILLSVGYMLRTGSRAVLMATVAVALVVFLLSRYKVQFLAAAVPVLAIGIMLTPAHTRHRLIYVWSEPTEASANTEEEISALGSQLQREQLLRESIDFTFRHPLLGVGPGEFMVAEAGTREQQGARGEWLGTHNSYTEVSSESGMPGFLFYVGTILVLLRMNLRVFKRVSGKPGLEILAGTTFCMLLSIIAYAISTFFFHITFSWYLPILGGISSAAYILARQIPEAYPESN